MTKNKILFIGYGKMGQAILGSLKSQNQFDFFIIDPDLTKHTQANLHFFASHEELTETHNFTYAFLAVKPQIITEVAKLYQPFLNDKTTIISILAGKSLNELTKLLGKDKKIIRLMPNLAAQFSHSTTTGCKTNNLSELEFREANNLCSKFGNVTWLKEESLMHISTAINGSGPALFAYLIKAITSCAQEHNLDTNQAKQLALSTMENSIEIIRSGINCEDLMSQVASKGGTTEALLESLTNNNTDQIIKNAIEAAITRSKLL